ncbi:hybrid sensor histidine kinase/response regulator [Vibrio agarivorans]|uniref:hybrid sensor histidine kinase/response regulator n=1 Tax=Vibrio agarivorans TaxID=153622 RepID=UPI0025B322DA|nr:hybrid sensor histidine kinase/response regulator [Vibrio agarivorans]MDN3660469.1 ATP-binding protein [Vibrio agarivorans]
MKHTSSLRRKSKIALTIYLILFIAVIGTVVFQVVEPPIRKQLQQNLDVRTQLLASQVEDKLNNSLSILSSIVSVGSAGLTTQDQADSLYSMFIHIDGIVVSGGLWPKPYSVNSETPYQSLFYNRASDGLVEQIYSWDNPENGGYDQQDWYRSVVNLPPGEFVWSPVYIDPFTHVQMITASSAYYVQGEFAGVATVDLSLVDLVSYILEHAEQYNLGVSLKDGFGEAITHYNFNIVKDIYISQREFGAFNWQMDVVNSKYLVSDQVFNLVSQVELALIPILLCCILLGYYMLNQYVIRPIVSIAENVRNSKESGTIDFEYNSNDEIRFLVDSFNQKTFYLEEERRKAEVSTEAKSAFLATLSHEIRTPMNGVLGTAQILLKSDLNPEQRKMMRTLYESGDHMMTLLNEILDFSKIEQGKLELDKSAFPLENIIGSVNSVYHTLCTEKGLDFRVHSDVPVDRWYFADKARVRQILFNLLNNAVKFTARGFVEVYFKEIHVGDKHYLSIRVRDTGIGIAKDAQSKVFSPFEQAESSTTRRFGGTGLGLAIVKQIAELMDGSITLSSELGIGSSFEVVARVELATPTTPQLSATYSKNCDGLKALVVEDNRTNAIILEALLKGKGFEVFCAENGEVALERLETDTYDLVLMDNHMPIMDGVEATRRIRKLDSRNAEVLILGCTADVFEETKQRMLAAGVDHIIAKPVKDKEFDDALYFYADKLRQYQDLDKAYQELNQFDDALESLVIDLSIAIDNQAYDQALIALHSIEPMMPSDNLEGKQLLESIQSQVTHQQAPSKDDMDNLVVQLLA